jgi:hypothetical protein
VTLIMSIVKPGEGAWYSVDNRVTEDNVVKGDDARKHIYLRCRAGAGALLCTGLAALYPGHTTMADYIRTTLRGDNRTFEGHAAFLRYRLNRDVARSRWRNEELIIHIVAFRGGVGRIRMTRRSRAVHGCTKWPTASAHPTTSWF